MGKIGTLIRGVTSKPLDGYSILDEIKDVCGAIGEGVGAETPAIVDSAGVDGVAIIGETSAELGAWPIILFCLLLIVAALLFENTLSRSVGWLPWGWGPRAASAVHWGFQPVHVLANFLADQAEAQVKVMGQALILIFSILLEGTLPQTNTIKGTPNAQTIAGLHSQIVTLNARVTKVEYELSQVKAELYPATHPTSSASVSLQSQVHDLQQQNQRLLNNQEILYNNEQSLRGGLETIHQEMVNLEGQVHGMGQVQTTWDNVIKQVEQLTSELQRTSHTQGEELSRQTRRVNQLEPLTLLLQPGLRGLRNLRKLEDNICQCPKFGGIGNDVGTALAVLEFVENG